MSLSLCNTNSKIDVDNITKKKLVIILQNSDWLVTPILCYSLIDTHSRVFLDAPGSAKPRLCIN